MSFKLPDGVGYDDLAKVTISFGKATHVASPWIEGITLCGWKWWFHCDLGTDHYCEKCQAKLVKIKAENATTPPPPAGRSSPSPEPPRP